MKTDSSSEISTVMADLGGDLVSTSRAPTDKPIEWNKPARKARCSLLDDYGRRF